MGTVKLLGGRRGCISVVALMPSKFFYVVLWGLDSCEVLGGVWGCVCILVLLVFDA